MKQKLLLFICLLITVAGFAQGFAIGDKVQAYNSGEWYNGTIAAIGSANYAGYYSVKWDKFHGEQWINGSNIRLAKNAAPSADAPRMGNYLILSYGSPTNPIRIGSFDLSNGQYTYYNAAKKPIGAGTYRYDAGTRSIQWLSGPFKQAGWSGSFETDRDGLTHKIRLNRVTIGSNSL